MNDYSVNGHLMPNSFVHISSEFTDDDTPIIRCSCQIYHFIQNVEMEQGSEIAPDTSCMHCRFFQEHLLNAYEVINEGCTNIPRPLEIVRSSIQFMNDPVLLLGDVLRTGTTKYSVKGDDYFSLVTVNFAGGICYIKCHSGFCAAANINKKRMPRSAKLNESAKLCSHLQTCYANIDTITRDFPQYFTESDEVVDDNENGNFGEDVNTEDDGSLSSELESNFDKETGLWSYKSLSQYKPMMSDNKNLHFSTRERIQFVVNYEPNRIIELRHPLTDQSGNRFICECGLEYTQECYVEEGTSNLYTRIGVAHIKYFGLKCPRNTCEKKFVDASGTWGMFFYTSTTCAGDEIGWDFIHAVKTSKISFTGFCNEMTRVYKTTHTNGDPFMSVKTFIGWFFGWLSAFKIDFRKEIDPYCGHNPKILACDGTHIGVSLRHLRLENPVTKADLNHQVPWLHGRVTRRLFQNEEIRTHVKYMALKAMNKLNEETLTPLEADERSIQLLEQVSNEPPLKDFLRQFFFPSVDNEIIEVQAQVLFQLSGEYQIESVLPQRAFDLIGTICDKVEKNEECGKDLLQMRRYNTQISDLFALSIKSSSTAVLPPFFRYLTEKVKSIHYGDLQPTPVEEIEGTYDPRTGTAYYFTASGNQLRKMPQYEKNSKDNKNREPRRDQDCRKVYPTVSHGGYSYILLWFCPIHGHSYGFHIIDGAEGPKDVFSSLLKYKEDMPQELFYDNACHLSEYCLNREPALFEDTRFWHDLFHAIAHLCGINFKSTRVEGFGGINTEICEQVNSYLQAIKYTGTHLSQDHFVFFLQFFLYLLNNDKTRRQSELASLAIAGMD